MSALPRPLRTRWLRGLDGHDAVANDNGAQPWSQLGLFGLRLALGRVDDPANDGRPVPVPPDASAGQPGAAAGSELAPLPPPAPPLTIRDKRLAANACLSCGRARDRGGVTCQRCLDADHIYRQRRKAREAWSGYLDENRDPLRLRGRPRMLPVLGPRRDCAHSDDCLDEMILATAPAGLTVMQALVHPDAQDPPGCSCPVGCRHFIPGPP